MEFVGRKSATRILGRLIVGMPGVERLAYRGGGGTLIMSMGVGYLIISFIPDPRNLQLTSNDSNRSDFGSYDTT
jgi:hypothetical protein